MDQTAIPWIMLVSVVAATGSAIAAAVSACFSSRSSQTAVDVAATACDAAKTADGLDRNDAPRAPVREDGTPSDPNHPWNLPR